MKTIKYELSKTEVDSKNVDHSCAINNPNLFR